jgi:hypothetical protein
MTYIAVFPLKSVLTEEQSKPLLKTLASYAPVYLVQPSPNSPGLATIDYRGVSGIKPHPPFENVAIDSIIKESWFAVTSDPAIAGLAKSFGIPSTCLWKQSTLPDVAFYKMELLRDGNKIVFEIFDSVRSQFQRPPIRHINVQRIAVPRKSNPKIVIPLKSMSEMLHQAATMKSPPRLTKPKGRPVKSRFSRY